MEKHNNLNTSPQGIVSKMVSYRRPWFRRKLFVALGDYYLERDRVRGERDLETLADTAKREACWLFVSEKNIWLNLARKHEEERDANGSLTGLSVSTQIPVLSEVGDASHYHVHVLTKGEKANARSEFADPERKLSALYESLVLATPSDGDMLCYAQIVNLYPNESIDFRVISHYGKAIVKFDSIADPQNVKAKYAETLSGKEISRITKDKPQFKGAIDECVYEVNEALKGILHTRFILRNGEDNISRGQN